MEVLITGPYGRVGTCILDHLYDRDEYNFHLFDLNEHPAYETIRGDVSDYSTVQTATDGMDAVVHLAVYPDSWTGPMEGIIQTNVIGTYNVLEACAANNVDKVIFASSHHAVGMYELDNAPEIYRGDTDLVVDHLDPVRPDSRYGAAKVFGEALGRLYVECTEIPRQSRNYEYAAQANRPGRDVRPTSFYALRLGSIRHVEGDHPYASAEGAVEAGETVRGSSTYETLVARHKALWQSRRDVAHMIDCCLADDSVAFDIFYGVSDNERRWLDIEHARDVIGYDPQDNGDAWEAPPTDGTDGSD